MEEFLDLTQSGEELAHGALEEEDAVPSDDEAGVSLESEVDESGENEYAPPKKRKRRPACLSSAYVPASIKKRVMEATSNRCWLCGLLGKHVAHIIAKSDKHLFNDYQRRGLLHMDNIHSFENLMYLCAGCHSGFDERVPVWAFLPVDLDSFIAAEEDFQRRRQEAADARHLLPRPGPPKRVPNIPYARYQIREEHLFTSIFLNHPIKNWAGSPIAAIVRSASIVSGQERLDADEKCGLPFDVARKFQYLLLLYGNRAPKVKVSVAVPPSIPHITVDDDYHGSSKGGPGSNSRRDLGSGPVTSKEPQHEKRTGNNQHPKGPERMKHTNSADHGDNDRSVYPVQVSPTGPRKRRRVPAGKGFFYGPHTTSDMLMSWCIDNKQNEKEGWASGDS